VRDFTGSDSLPGMFCAPFPLACRHACRNVGRARFIQTCRVRHLSGFKAGRRTAEDVLGSAWVTVMP
jgi:hypothetical protein